MQRTQVGSGGAAHSLHDVTGGVFEKAFQTESGLGDDRYGASRKGLESGSCALFGERGADDHRRRAFGHDFPEEADAVHARHFDIDDEHVRPACLHFFKGEQRVGGGGDNLDAGVAGQGLCDHLTDHRRVIDDHDLYLVSHACSLTVAP